MTKENSALNQKVIIFIPFGILEDNKELIENAIKWQQALEFTKDNRVPDIVIYCKDVDEEKILREIWGWNEDIYYALSNKDIPDNAVLYITGHGTDSPEIGNSSEPNKFINMAKLAKRLKHAGFTPELLNKITNLKLYCCESRNGIGLQLAENLAIELGSEYSKLNITHYTALVTTCYVENAPDGPNKYAGMQLGCNRDKPEVMFLGRASEFSETISVGETIAKTTSPTESTFENKQLLFNKGYDPSYATNSQSELSDCKEIEATVIQTSTSQVINLDNQRLKETRPRPEDQDDLQINSKSQKTEQNTIESEKLMNNAEQPRFR